MRKVNKLSKEEPKDKVKVNPNNPGLLKGRSIAFAKFCFRNYKLIKEEEPCWQSDDTKILLCSKDVYNNYIAYLHNN